MCNYSIQEICSIIAIIVSIISCIIAFISCINSQKQYLSNIKPFLEIANVNFDGNPTPTARVTMQSSCNRAILLDVIRVSSNVDSIKSKKGILESGDDEVDVDIKFKKAIDSNNCKFKIAIRYTDQENNKYAGILKYEKNGENSNMYIRDMKYMPYWALRLYSSFIGYCVCIASLFKS